ncbi:hypothetical protein RUM43_004783 [Polyplax serrata]|uniref:Uncharacterized protein n=1 Tax=Polyplax serrata TaxID=468196 RepID=A0AAN8SB72_POLSC
MFRFINQQYHERVVERPAAESWTGRGPTQRVPHTPQMRGHQEKNEEEFVQTSIDDGKHSLLQFAMHHFRQSPEK